MKPTGGKGSDSPPPSFKSQFKVVHIFTLSSRNQPIKDSEDSNGNAIFIFALRLQVNANIFTPSFGTVPTLYESRPLPTNPTTYGLVSPYHLGPASVLIKYLTIYLEISKRSVEQQIVTKQTFSKIISSLITSFLFLHYITLY